MVNEDIAHYLETKRYIDEPEVLPWYKADLVNLKAPSRELLEKYSNVPAADVESHIKKVRDNAFKIFPYPCLGNWGFLDLSIIDSPDYKEVLERIKNGEKYLDIGCCMGQDIRKLIHDGAPLENIVGSDLQKAFWDIGFELFLDQSKSPVRFIEADVFDANSDLKDLDGTIDIVHAASFFHLFSYDGQLKAAKRVINLLKAKPGVMIVGRQGGMPEATELPHPMKGGSSYWHNAESWTKLWKQAGEETGTTWDMECVLGEEDLSKRLQVSSTLIPGRGRFLTFTIRRT